MIFPRSTKMENKTMTSSLLATTKKNLRSSVLLGDHVDDETTPTPALALAEATTNEAWNYNSHRHNHHNHHHHHHLIKTSKTQTTNSVRLANTGATNNKTTLVLAQNCRLLAALLLFSWTILLVGAIKLQPEGREKFYWSGEQFVITCQNTNNIKNVKIRWIGPNGSDITEDRSQRVHAESTGPHGHRLVVMNATAPDDDGQYKCTLGSADDRNPREHLEFNLKIYKQTSFKDTPRHLVLTAGQQGTLSCRVEFDPAALSTGVSWVRDQRPIEMFNDSTYTVLDYDPSRQLSQLIISPLTKQHDGVYTCRAMAETSRLSKISDYDIRLETNYAPTFDVDSQTVWVERNRSPSSSAAARVSAEQTAARQQQQQANFYPNGVPRNSAHQPGVRNRHNRPGYSPAGSRESAELVSGNSNSSAGNIVQVELRCTCQANPPASILWTSTQNSMYVLAKGEPAHVLEQPRTEIDGANTTSILLIGYNLDQDWQFRRDSYICSASNKLGKASKTFTIEQGDPPPAFSVGPQRQYNPETSLFKFTLLGPIFDEQSSSSSSAAAAAAAASSNNRSQQPLSSMHSLGNSHRQQAHEILPPVDSFRIRAEIPTDQSSSPSSSSAHGGGDPKSSYTRRLHHQQVMEPLSVQWNLDQALNFHSNRLVVPQNFTVNLGKLPSGNQRLFLEAHNAVGWSPDSTYLGEYYIVSGASSALMMATTQGVPPAAAAVLLANLFVMLATSTSSLLIRQQNNY